MPDAATTAWVNAVIANGGGVSAGCQTLVDNLIVTLKTTGIWSKCDQLWLYATENTPAALTDLVALTLATIHGSPSFTPNRGFTGVDASTTVYIDTNTNPATLGQYTLNAAHLSLWNNTNVASGASGGDAAGLHDSAFHTAIDPEYSDGKLLPRVQRHKSVGCWHCCSRCTRLFRG